MDSREDFEGRIGQDFEATVAEETGTLRLAEVRPLSGDREGGAFSAVFVHPDRSDLPQDIYRIAVDGDKTALLLVPIGPFGDGFGYEAVFA